MTLSNVRMKPKDSMQSLDLEHVCSVCHWWIDCAVVWGVKQTVFYAKCTPSHLANGSRQLATALHYRITCTINYRTFYPQVSRRAVAINQSIKVRLTTRWLTLARQRPFPKEAHIPGHFDLHSRCHRMRVTVNRPLYPHLSTHTSEQFFGKLLVRTPVLLALRTTFIFEWLPCHRVEAKDNGSAIFSA